jgi:trans-aconitate methyltransferase
MEAYHGKRPNPADLPDGASEWPFIRQLNQKAYDIISDDYQEEYFSNPMLTGMFDEWLAGLPADANILDAGCGHGDPVIARMLERKNDCRITGTDLSPKMLARARGAFPNVTFENHLVSEIRYDAEFDGACSLSSLLYLDSIDLSHSIYRLYRALRPGGMLFVYANDLHPDYRGLPYRVDINQWMWSWSHGMEEATYALEEFGYFKVLKVQDVTTEEERERRIASWRKYTQEEYEKHSKIMTEGAIYPPPDLSKIPTNLAYGYVVIARREA